MEVPPRLLDRQLQAMAATEATQETDRKSSPSDAEHRGEESGRVERSCEPDRPTSLTKRVAVETSSDALPITSG